MKIAFLDRDGTINKDYPDAEWTQIEDPEILPGAIEGMRELLARGYEIIIITNQYTIGEGYISLEQYQRFTGKLLQILEENSVRILDIFYCPHARNANCDCCKPRTGLIKQAIAKYPHINLSESFMCGDSVNDLECAKQMGLPFYGIGIGESQVENLVDLCKVLEIGY